MRMLGSKASLAAFRWDLVYLLARLMADKRDEVKALAPKVQGLRDALAAQRATHEGAEDAVVIASALVDKEDENRDDVVKQLGGVARVTDKGAYAVLFPKLNPSATARLPLDEESAEIARIVGQLGAMAPEHPLRAAYLTTLTDAETGLKAADQQSDTAVTALALQRSQTERLKLSLDKGRLEVHGTLVTILKDKAVVEAFFRPTASAPDEAEKKEGPAPQPK